MRAMCCRNHYRQNGLAILAQACIIKWKPASLISFRSYLVSMAASTSATSFVDDVLSDESSLMVEEPESSQQYLDAAIAAWKH